MPTATDAGQPRRAILGMPGNRGREPRARQRDGKGTPGDMAFCDAIAIIAVCILVILFFGTTLRHHNI